MSLTTLFTNLREWAIATESLDFAEAIAPQDLVQLLEDLEFADRAYARDNKGRFAKENTRSSAPDKKLTPITDKSVIKSKIGTWLEQHKQMKQVMDFNALKSNIKNLDEVITLSRKRQKRDFVLPDGITIEGDLLKKLKDYHDKNLQITTQETPSGTFYRFNGDKVAGVISQESDGNYYLSLSRLNKAATKPIPFRNKEDASSFLLSVANDYAREKLIPQELQQEVSSYVKKQLKSKGEELKDNPYKNQDPEILSDNMFIGEEISSYLDNKQANVLAMVDENGNLQSATKYSLKSGHIYIDYLATAPWNLSDSDERRTKGGGAKTLAQAAKLSIEKDRGGKLKLTPLDKAKPFYHHIGLEDDKDGMKLSTSAAQKLIEKYG